MVRRGGGPPPPDSVCPVFFNPTNQRRHSSNPDFWVQPPPVKPFFAAHGSDLAHSRQEGWECLLLAFRAAIRSRSPSTTIFLENLSSSGRVVNALECAESGIPTLLLRFWMSRFCDNFVLKLIRRHPWATRSVVESFFSHQVILY